MVRTRSWLLWLAVTVMLCWRPDSAQPQQTLPLGIALPPSLNFATSPSPVGSGARAVGKGSAFIGVADDATAASHNPAGLVQLQRPEVSVVGSYFARLEGQDVTQPDTALQAQHLDSADLNYLSVVYPFEVWRRNVTVSLNMQRLFDLRSATDVTSRFTSIDGVQQVQARQAGGLWTIAPAAAVQLTPTVSVGVACNIWPDLFDNGWQQEVDVRGTGFLGVGNRLVRFTSAGHITEDFNFRGVNVTAGFLWALTPVVSLGGVFRSPFRASVTRTHASSLTVMPHDGTPPVTAQDSFRDTLDMDMPLSYGLGLAVRPADNLTLALDVARVHWSDFRLYTSRSARSLLVENGAPAGKGTAVLRGAADDITSVRLGAEYLWLRPPLIVPLRSGFFYDPEPGNGRTDHFFGFSLGTGVVYRQSLFDLAYTFRRGTVHSQATDTGVTQHTVLASLMYRF